MTLWKKILYSALFVGIALVFGYIIFRIFFAPTPENANLANANINGGLPNVNLINRPPIAVNINVNEALPNVNIAYQKPTEIASGGATVVSPIVEKEIQNVALASNKKDLVYYDKTTGEFKRITSDGSQEALLTQEKFPGATGVEWSPARDKVALSFPDDSKIVYDLNKKKQFSLPKETTEFSFSPSSQQLAYKYEGFNQDERWLAISNPDGSGAKVIEKLGDKAPFVDVNWSPDNQVIATYARSTGSDRQEIIFLGQYNENFPSVEVQGAGFKGKYSPAGDKMLYSVSSKVTNYSPSLWVMDASISNLGEHPQQLNIETWPEKCSFGLSNTIYCAVPRFMPQGSDIYPELADGIPDDFYKIDLKTGSTTLLANPVNASGLGNFTADKVYLSANDEFLYFTDKSTGRLYKIRLR